MIKATDECIPAENKHSKKWVQVTKFGWVSVQTKMSSETLIHVLIFYRGITNN